MIFKDRSIFSTFKSVFRIYNILYDLKNVDNGTFISLDILTVMKMDIMNLAGIILDGWIKVKRKNILIFHFFYIIICLKSFPLNL